MSATAADQLRRILHLIPRLADDEEHRIADLATSLGASSASLLADFASISDRFDAPGGFVDGVSIFVESDSVSVHANHFHRPMRLTMPELCALELGLTMLHRERTPAEQAPIGRALERLRKAISEVPSNDRHEGTRYAELAIVGSAEHLAELRRACKSKRKVSIRYRGGGATESTMRVICPHATLFAEGMWYVIALCDDAVARFFRLDRVEHVTLLESAFEPDASLLERVTREGKVFSFDTPRRMTVYYSPRVARWVAEREGKPLADDGSLTLEHAVADDSWAIRHVLQFGAEAQLLEPRELREMLVARLDAMLSAS